MKLTELDAIFGQANKQAQDEYDWYAKNRYVYAIFSWLIRIVAALALVFATILPLSGSTTAMTLLGFKFSSPAHAAVALLALAGLLVGANQVFMISTTWSRYVNAMMKIRTLQKIAELDWKAQKVELSDSVSPADAQKAFGTFKTLVVGARQIVETETSNWSAELVKAIEQLQGLIKEQKAAVETLAKEEQKAKETAQQLVSAATNGTICIKIEGDVDRLKVPFRISAGKRTREILDHQTTMVLSDIVGGIHTVVLSGNDADGKPITVEDVVQVAPNAIANVTLNVPKGLPRNS